MYKRRVYSVIDILGDIGGLKEALRLVAILLIGSYAKISKETTMISHNFQYIEKGKFLDTEAVFDKLESQSSRITEDQNWASLDLRSNFKFSFC